MEAVAYQIDAKLLKPALDELVDFDENAELNIYGDSLEACSEVMEDTSDLIYWRELQRDDKLVFLRFE